MPSIFAHSQGSNPYSRSQSRKAPQPSIKTADGQSFPFQIVKEEGFNVQYETDNGAWNRGDSSGVGTRTNTRIVAGSHTDDEDNDIGSDHSGEWIMMQEKPGLKVIQV
jgi:hypothetical protein